MAKKQAPPERTRANSKSPAKKLVQTKPGRTRSRLKVADEAIAESPNGNGEEKKGSRSRIGKASVKRRIKEDDDDEGDCENENDNVLYRLPMNRVSRIIRTENLDIRISQEAVFVINRATEKFLQLLCSEAYARSLVDKKKFVAYNHLASTISKRECYTFLSDFIPQKVKAEDALAQMQEAEEQTPSSG
ncbi:DNA polymerase II subunit B3-1 [Andrographis paniculata]|uniref:DNA polymerase II subunit B3-1 n=1 Tax=Andrographis paniculata TaxID=175694 RepID=UPI0021E75445|nr:DNA polymerase II subunit B3-1 [Andrographis paniculata]